MCRTELWLSLYILSRIISTTLTWSKKYYFYDSLSDDISLCLAFENLSKTDIYEKIKAGKQWASIQRRVELSSSWSNFFFKPGAHHQQLWRREAKSFCFKIISTAIGGFKLMLWFSRFLDYILRICHHTWLANICEETSQDSHIIMRNHIKNNYIV